MRESQSLLKLSISNVLHFSDLTLDRMAVKRLAVVSRERECLQEGSHRPLVRGHNVSVPHDLRLWEEELGDLL